MPGECFIKAGIPPQTQAKESNPVFHQKQIPLLLNKLQLVTVKKAKNANVPLISLTI